MLEVTLCSIKVDVLEVYWFFNIVNISNLGLEVVIVVYYVEMIVCTLGVLLGEDACVVSRVTIFVVAE
jgi:hypothetical protein